MNIVEKMCIHIEAIIVFCCTKYLKRKVGVGIYTSLWYLS